MPTRGYEVRDGLFLKIPDVAAYRLQRLFMKLDFVPGLRVAEVAPVCSAFP